MKRSIIAVPALLIGIGVGGMVIPQAFAASTPNTASTTTATYTSTAASNDWLNYMDSMMSRFFGSGTAQNGNWLNYMNSMMSQYFGSGNAKNGANEFGSMMGGYYGSGNSAN